MPAFLASPGGVSPAYLADFGEIKAALHADNDATFVPAIRSVNVRVVTLYGRVGCGLCEEAATLLRGWQSALRFTLREVDIDGDPALLAAYDWIVPVVAVDGTEVGRAPIDAVALRQRLHALLAR